MGLIDLSLRTSNNACFTQKLKINKAYDQSAPKRMTKHVLIERKQVDKKH